MAAPLIPLFGSVTTSPDIRLHRFDADITTQSNATNIPDINVYESDGIDYVHPTLNEEEPRGGSVFFTIQS